MTVKVCIQGDSGGTIDDWSNCNSMIDGSLTAITSTDLAGIVTTRDRAFSYFPLLSSVSLNSSIKYLGHYTFSECPSLASVTLPYILQTGDITFTNCTALASASLPAVTSIGLSTFNGCTNLTSVNLPLLVSMGRYSFKNCSSLATLTLPKLNTLNNYDFESYYGCTSLSSFSAVSVTSVANMCMGYTLLPNLRTITLGNKVTSIVATAFTNQTSITSIIIAKPAGSIAGAPWGATNATVTWTG